ncbi:beta-1,6-N-acetylglucosaminyltransferase [Kineococcus sp. SYSU DK003]|uniref:beta-1,6-N-acetylglucosaminyltransferase n=1 Tax=Kineococcus sp. SYSU DK003 TaxID=3383124 RepID=UPI003D7E6A5C
MVTLAAVVMAHQDPQHVRRLIARLGDVPVVLHCDVKTPREQAREMVRGWGSRVLAVPRRDGRLSSWSLVRIEMEAVRAALHRFSADRVAVLSGADYLLCRPEEVLDRLEPWQDRTCMVNLPVPYRGWDAPRHRDGGMWRMDRRFFVHRDQLLTLGSVPLRRPWRRPIPDGLRLRASSQWKVWSRPDAERVLTVLDERPDLVDFWRTSLVPDETFVASILSSPRITGRPAAPDNHAHVWFQRWAGGGAYHPEWLTDEDLPEVERAVRRPGTAAGPQGASGGEAVRPLFARKVSSQRSSGLLDAVDALVDGGAWTPQVPGPERGRTG